MKREKKLQNTTETAIGYEPLLATVFNLSDLTDNLKTFGELKNEVETQRKKKLVTSNEIYLLNTIDSLTDRLIEMHKIILINAGR